MVYYGFSTVQEGAAPALRNNSKLKKWTEERREMKGNHFCKKSTLCAVGSRSRHIAAWGTHNLSPPTPAGQLQGLWASMGETGATHPLNPKLASSLALALCPAKSRMMVGPLAWPQSSRRSAGSCKDVAYLRPYSQEAAFNSDRH